MQPTSSVSSARPRFRAVVLGSIIAASAALFLAAGCNSGGDTGTPGADGGASGSGTTPGPSLGSGPSTSAGASNSSGGASTIGGGGVPASSAGGGGASGSSAVGSNGGAGGAAAKPCVDVQPPADPKWPGATCQNWATETSECTAAWFANYCDVSCHRCVPPNAGSGGCGNTSGGSGNGSAGANSSAGSGNSSAGANSSAGGPAAVVCSKQGLPNVTSGNGYATRYWDCCQTHCAQFDGHRCGQDGTTQTGSTSSACSGGSSFACYDESPHAISDCVSYGYIAKSNPNCGGCYRIQFTGQGQYNANDPGSKAIQGKQMVVKVSNTGGDVATNQFDLMIPGGGVGQFNACSKQWGSSDLGAQYGGFLTNCTGTYAAKKDCVRTQCTKIPAGAARDGCLWFVDWFQAADNPKFTFESTSCPF